MNQELQESSSVTPPRPTSGLFGDLRTFLFRQPPITTLIAFPDPEERENYSKRIIQRLGIDVDRYKLLNIHQIGINAPVKYVFEELQNWDHRSVCWPNRILEMERSGPGDPHLESQAGAGLETVRFYVLGRKKYPFGLKRSFFGLRFIPLFRMDALNICRLPEPGAIDNARYLLYECSGGYPIGIFAVYARSSIAQQGEIEPTQFFMVVSFNFYGKVKWSTFQPLNRLWEWVHNRVTANTMNRFKRLCESRFHSMQTGILSPAVSRSVDVEGDVIDDGDNY